VKRLFLIALAACAAFAATPHRASAGECGISGRGTIWVDFADGSVPFWQEFARPGVIAAAANFIYPPQLRALGARRAEAVFWGADPEFFAPQEVEKELREQIDRAMHSGLKIDYVDYHMGTAVRYPEFREIAERLAKEYGLGMSQYFGDLRHDSQYEAAPRDKTDSLVAMIDRLKPRFNLVITHVGIDDAELGALVDMNTSGPLPDMSKNRQGELDALMSPRFRDALKTRNIQLLTYRQLIVMQGLNSMRRPEG